MYNKTNNLPIMKLVLIQLFVQQMWHRRTQKWLVGTFSDV